MRFTIWHNQRPKPLVLIGHALPEIARYLTGGQMTLQGNFDPARLLSPIAEIEKQTREMIEQFGTTNYIANLGHGILPNIPVDHAKAFVDTVKSYQPRSY